MNQINNNNLSVEKFLKKSKKQHRKNQNKLLILKIKINQTVRNYNQNKILFQIKTQIKLKRNYR